MNRTLIATGILLASMAVLVPNASATWCISAPGFICQQVDGALTAADHESTYQEACAYTPLTPYQHLDCAAHDALPDNPFCLPLSQTDFCVTIG